MADRIATIYDLARYCRDNDYDCRRCVSYNYENCVHRLVGTPNKANEEILKWCDEHPAKTYKDDFLEKFPNCKTYESAPIPCRNIVYGISGNISCDRSDCAKCWNEVMPE